MDIGDLERVSGNLALDFLNTVEDRLRPEREELLRTPEDLAEWGLMTGVLASPSKASGERQSFVRNSPTKDSRTELAAALALRERLTTLLEAHVAGELPDPADLAALAGAVADAHAAATLAPGADGELRWRWDPANLASVRHTVADAAFELLSGPAAARIGECDGPGCGWFFLDQTKRGNRRWCTMADCGQEAKSAGRRARRGA